MQRFGPQGWSLGRLPGFSSGEIWPVVSGLALAVLAGYLTAGGSWLLAVALVVTPIFLLIAATAPERTSLGLIVVLPFCFYPASVGGFSLFIAVPLFAFTGLMLMTRQQGSLHNLRGWLPVPAFAVLVTIAIATAAVSSDPTTAFSRVLYLVLFGWFAWGLATALRSGRLSREAVVMAVVCSGALAAVAILIQFVAQFAGGQQAVIDWLRGVQATFAGERAAGISTINWLIKDLNLLRGIFPFMSPPTAGQYMMLSFVAAIWLRRERAAAAPGESKLVTCLLILIGAALLATFSRQAWIGAIAGVLVLGIRTRPMRVMLIVLLALILISITPIPGGSGTFGNYLLQASDTSSTSSGTRLGLWEQGLDHVPGHALVGVGPGLYSTLNPDPISHPVYYAHNVFLDMAVELGIAGALAFTAVLVLALASAFRRSAMLPFALLAAYLVANLFDDVFYTPRNGLLLAVVFALIAAPVTARRSGRDSSAADTSGPRLGAGVQAGERTVSGPASKVPVPT